MKKYLIVYKKIIETGYYDDNYSWVNEEKIEICNEIVELDKLDSDFIEEFKDKSVYEERIIYNIICLDN